MNIEREAKIHMERKLKLFFEELEVKLQPVRKHIEENLREDIYKVRALQDIDDILMIAKYAAEKYGLKPFSGKKDEQIAVDLTVGGYSTSQF